MGSATLTSGRTCTPTPSCPEAPPCTPVLLTACRRRSPPWLPPPSRSRSSLPREEVLRLDRRLHPGFPLHLPADADLQAGVRRVRPLHCPPQVLLSASQLSWKKNNILDPIATIFIYLSVGFSLLFYSTILPLSFGRLTSFSSI